MKLLSDIPFNAQPGPLLFSGLFGAMVPLALSAKITLRNAITLTFVGLAVSYYVTPLICYFFNIGKSEFAPAVGFLVGMLGVKIAQSIINYADTVRLQTLLARVVEGSLNKRLPPEPPATPEPPSSPAVPQHEVVVMPPRPNRRSTK